MPSSMTSISMLRRLHLHPLTHPPTRPPSPQPARGPTHPPTPCGPGSDYAISQSTGVSLVPGTNLVTGSQCNECTVSIDIPFTYDLYGQPFSSFNASSNGNIQFSSNNSTKSNVCLGTTSV